VHTVSAPLRHRPLIDLGIVPAGIATVGRGGLDPGQVAAALAAKDHELAQLRQELALAVEQADTAAATLSQWHTWHRDNCLGPAAPRPHLLDPARGPTVDRSNQDGGRRDAAHRRTGSGGAPGTVRGL
jgi:hypothetical protein